MLQLLNNCNFFFIWRTILSAMGNDVDHSVFDNEISSIEIAYLIKQFRNFLKITIKMQETKTLLTIRM